MAEEIDFEGLANPFGYFDDTEKLLEYLKNQHTFRSGVSTLLGLYYTDDRIAVSLDANKVSGDGRSYVTGQEIGLPARITGITDFTAFGGDKIVIAPISTDAKKPDLPMKRKEPLTQNEIGWRVDTVVEALYGELPGGRPFKIVSKMREDNETLADEIEGLLDLVFEAQDEPSWLEAFARRGGVQGYVDVVIRLDEDVAVTVDAEDGERVEPKKKMDPDEFAESLQLYIPEPREIAPLTDPKDCTKLGGYILQYETNVFPTTPKAGSTTSSDGVVRWMEVYVPGKIRIYKSDPTVESGKWLQDGEDVVVPESRIPVVHHQHVRDARRYEGRGEVEPLMPSQDEINTRFSDRGRGVTYGSNPPWLGKGILNFHKQAMAPDLMIEAINEDGSIERIASDANDEGQNRHIEDLFDGLDKISKIPPIAAGLIKDSIGNLTSSTALRTVLRGFLGKIARIRKGHNKTVPEICDLILTYANDLGVLTTKPEERKTTIEWGDVVEMSSTERLDEALKKKGIGVPNSQLLEEIGYTEEKIGEFKVETDREAEEMEKKFGIADDADRK